MGEHHKMHQWFERLRESWAVRFWVVRGAILLLVFLILLIVIFDMNWLSIVLTAFILVVAVVIFFNVVGSLNDFISTFKK